MARRPGKAGEEEFSSMLKSFERYSIQNGNQTLVLDLVVRSIKCPRLLRTCRLVCQAGNVSACAALRSMVTAATTVTVDNQKRNLEPSLEKLRRLDYAVKAAGTLPTPFRKVSFKIPMRCFDSLQENLNKDLILTELELEIGAQFDYDSYQEGVPMKLMSILNTYSQSLEVLKIHIYKDHPVDGLNTGDFEQMQFPKLKKFQIDYFGSDNFFRQSFVELLIRAIVHNSTLDLLQLKSMELSKLKELLIVRGINFGNRTTLQLESYGRKTRAFDRVALLKCESSEDTLRVFPGCVRVNAASPWQNLTELKITKASEQEVVEIVSFVSESLQVLDTDEEKIPLQLLPICPKLLDMRGVFWFSRQLLAEKFPSLKIFHNRGLWIDYCRLDFGNIVPNYGVVEAGIGIEYNQYLPHKANSFCYFCKKWESWAKEFPEMKSYFQLNGAQFCNVSTALRALSKFFPKLKSLSIYGSVVVAASKVVQRNSSALYCQEDILKLPIHSFYMEIFPFEEFRELESLDLHRLRVNSKLIESSLSKIPKLKYLRIRMHEGLTWGVVRNYLRHLKVVAIQDCRSKGLRDCRVDQRQRYSMRKMLQFVWLYCNCSGCDNPLG